MTATVDVAEAYERAQMFFDSGDPAGGARFLAPAVAAEPRNQMIRLLLARAYFHSAQLHKAEQQFRDLLDLDPTDDYAHFALGRTLQRQSRPAEAAGCYRVAYALRPDPDYAAALERLQHR